jgi:predicted ATP-grasp superfamily ATP-dependent carboligase
VSEIEYKYDRRSGKHVLIEINPRFWDQHGLGVAAGVNLARCMFLDVTTGELPQQHQSAASFTWVADDGLVTSLVSSFRGKSYRAADFRRALQGRTVPAVLDAKDLRPAASLSAELLRHGASALWQRLSGMFSRRHVSPVNP